MRKPSSKKTREAIENGSFASWPKKTQEGALLTPNMATSIIREALQNCLHPDLYSPQLYKTTDKA